MNRPVNLGGIYMNLFVFGADDALSKLDELTKRIKEVNELIADLNQHTVTIRQEFVTGSDECQ